MSDRKNYNGLHLPGSLAGRMPTEAEKAAQAQRAIALEMQAISREIFVRSASDFVQVSEVDAPELSERFQAMARQSQLAARSYFLGLGIIQDHPAGSPESTEEHSDEQA